jgi:hypothetical protein
MVAMSRERDVDGSRREDFQRFSPELVLDQDVSPQSPILTLDMAGTYLRMMADLLRNKTEILLGVDPLVRLSEDGIERLGCNMATKTGGSGEK